jgi:hypothetical protein
MTIDYKIDKNDFQTFQLFVASKFDRIKKKRQRSKIIVPIIYIALGLLFQDKVLLAIVFFIIGLLWFLIHPMWERRHYIKHYKSLIEENYKDRLIRTAT